MLPPRQANTAPAGGPALAHRPQILLVGVSVWHRQFDADTMYPTTPSAALLLLKAKDHRRRKGLNDENYLSPASWEKCFLLTFPFIEPAQGTPGNRHRLRRGMRRGLYRKIAQFRLSPFFPHFSPFFETNETDFFTRSCPRFSIFLSHV